jgi:hypothetical protein
VTIRAIDGAGHMGISGVLSYLRPGPERPPQRFEFFLRLTRRNSCRPSKMHMPSNHALHTDACGRFAVSRAQVIGTR